MSTRTPSHRMPEWIRSSSFGGKRKHAARSEVLRCLRGSKAASTAAPSRVLERVKPAGLHVVEEETLMAKWFYPASCVEHSFLVLPSKTRFFQSEARLFPSNIYIFPCPATYSFELLNRWDMVVGYVRERIQELQSTECRAGSDQNERGASEVEAAPA